MSTWQILLTVSIAVSLARELPRSRKALGDHLKFWAGMRPRHFAWGALSISTVVAVFYAIHLAFPVLTTITWLSWLDLNPTNIALGPALWGGPLLAVITVLVLLFLLPRLAWYEEHVFRDGRLDPLDQVWRAFWFGMIHMVMGVPLSAALALAFGGGVFQVVWNREYMRDKLKHYTAFLSGLGKAFEGMHRQVATTESARAHTAHNVLALVLLVTALLSR